MTTTTTKTEQATEARPEGAPWTLANARKFLSVSERTLRRLTSSGRVRTIKLAGKPMIPDSEVRRLAADGV